MNKLTVVIPAYYAEDTIMRAIKSIQNSSEPANIIVVEDGVYDNLQSKLNDIENLQLVTKLHNEGASAARNTGLDLVVTKYVFFLDSDDYVDANLFTSLIDVLSEKKADLGFGPWTFVYDNISSDIIKFPQNKSNTEYIADWLRSICFPPCSVMWRTEAIRQIGGWNETYSNKDDTELVIRALMSDLNVAITDKGCGFYVQHESGMRLSRLPAKIASEASDRIYQTIFKSKSIQSNVDIRSALAFFCYEQARRTYRSGEKDLGLLWHQRARDLGLSSHLGSSSHILLSSLLGLKLKENLASYRDRFSFIKHRFK